MGMMDKMKRAVEKELVSALEAQDFEVADSIKKEVIHRNEMCLDMMVVKKAHYDKGLEEKVDFGAGQKVDFDLEMEFFSIFKDITCRKNEWEEDQCTKYFVDHIKEFQMTCPMGPEECLPEWPKFLINGLQGPMPFR